jgi:hypothetical protein
VTVNRVRRGLGRDSVALSNAQAADPAARILARRPA